MPAYHTAKVLVIDDEKHTRTIILRLLMQIGVRSISEAEDGRSGYLEVLRVRPDLVFCDVHMLDGDGRTFLKVLRAAKLPGVAQTPVVFLTADAERDTVLFAKDHAVRGYLVKPVSLNDIKGRLDAVLAPS